MTNLWVEVLSNRVVQLCLRHTTRGPRGGSQPSTTLKNAAAALLESMDLAGAEDSFVKFVLCTHAAGMDRPLRSLSTVINDLKKHG